MSHASTAATSFHSLPKVEQTTPGQVVDIWRRESAVPRFYFDVRDGTKFTPDDEGLEFDTLEAAEFEAASAATEIGRDRLPKRDSCEVAIELRNEHRQRVLTVTVSMDVQRVDPPPPV